MNGRITKRPHEKFDIDFDFARDIPDGDSLPASSSASSVTVTPSGLTLSSSPAREHSGTIVKQWIEAGTDEEDYRVVCRATTTDGRVFELVMVVEVRDDTA